MPVIKLSSIAVVEAVLAAAAAATAYIIHKKQWAFNTEYSNNKHLFSK